LSGGIISADEMTEIGRMAKAMHLDDAELKILMGYEQYKSKNN
jgi:hypothetical protein|tara:strand:- start:246 stop:374 length:129 start_codon:yes stop_codon:yes gene_type:complete